MNDIFSKNSSKDVTDQYRQYVGMTVMVTNEDSEYSYVTSNIYEVYDLGDLGMWYKLTNGLVFKQSEIGSWRFEMTDLTELMKQRDEIDARIDNFMYNSGSDYLYVLSTENKTHGYFRKDELLCACAYLEVIAETNNFISIGLFKVMGDNIEDLLDLNKHKFPLCEMFKEYFNGGVV